MYEAVGKTLAASFLMLGLAIGLIGISNNPDSQLTEVGMTDGISKPAETGTTETISSHGESEHSIQKLPKTQKGMERPRGQA
ncbi:MAG: hypothetical protein ABEJ07_01255 [Candidatus Nanohaloarchaea archaeon]